MQLSPACLLLSFVALFLPFNFFYKCIFPPYLPILQFLCFLPTHLLFPLCYVCLFPSTSFLLSLSTLLFFQYNGSLGSPNTPVRNSLYAMCCISATTIRRVSWNSRLSDQVGFRACSCPATLLCSRTHIVCISVNSTCSFTRSSPVKDIKVAWLLENIIFIDIELHVYIYYLPIPSM